MLSYRYEIWVDDAHVDTVYTEEDAEMSADMFSGVIHKIEINNKLSNLSK